MKTIKALTAALVLGVVLLGAVILSMRAGWWTPSMEEGRRIYAAPPSKFLRVDGVDIHYRDEGAGPVLIMMAGTFGNLHLWDGWTERLKGRYRVIRFDWPPYGFSGPDPTGEFDLPRTVHLMEGFIHQLGLSKFTFVGVSNGSTAEELYTDAHPEEVSRLILSDIVLRPPSGQRYVSRELKFYSWIGSHLLPNYVTRGNCAANLHYLFGVPDRVTDAMVELCYYSTNVGGNVAGQRALGNALNEMWKTFDIRPDLAKIRVPVLIEWPDKDYVLPASAGDEALAAFKNAPARIIHYPDGGHYLMWEIPDRTAADALEFLEATD